MPDLWLDDLGRRGRFQQPLGEEGSKTSISSFRRGLYPLGCCVRSQRPHCRSYRLADSVEVPKIPFMRPVNAMYGHKKAFLSKHHG